MKGGPLNIQGLLVLVLLAGCAFLSLNDLRSSGLWVVGVWMGLIAISVFATKYTQRSWSFGQVLTAGIIARLLMFLAMPTLSDDIWRFLWDGRLMLEGVNPYLVLPSEWIDSHPISSVVPLYELLNSPEYFTVYPPLAQFIFGIATYLGGADILWETTVMRAIVGSIELSGIYALYKALPRWGIAGNRAYWLLLSPILIVECTGNLHFEGAMIGLLCWSVYFASCKRWFLASMLFAGAILAKLLPVLFIPVLWRVLGWKKALKCTAIVALTCLAFSIPFLSLETIKHFGSSLDLYFEKFEFNASVYFLLRELFFLIKGYNMIAVLGPALALITLIWGLVWAFRVRWSARQLPQVALITLGAYLALSTTVHPWYGCSLVLLAASIGSRNLVIAGSLFTISYFFYWDDSFVHRWWWLVFEYGAIAFFVVCAIRKGDLSIRKTPATYPTESN